MLHSKHSIKIRLDLLSAFWMMVSVSLLASSFATLLLLLAPTGAFLLCDQTLRVHRFCLQSYRQKLFANQHHTNPLRMVNDDDDSPRDMNRRLALLFESGILFTTASLSGPNTAMAAPTKAAPLADNSREALRSARKTLQTLLDNWEKAVIDCTFADVPRELLEQKNKQQLLEKASTFALFDKSVSVETCKTTNRVVRDYLGATGIGPLVNLEKQLKNALDQVNPDYLEDYVTEIESIQQILAKARSLSYTAGVADFSSVNNFEKDQVKDVLANNSNLEQSRQCIEQIVNGLSKIEAMFKS